MARIKYPKILTASDLKQGDVIFFTGTGWSRHHLDAKPAQTDAEIAALEAQAKADVAANRILDVQIIDVALRQDGKPEPIHYREKMRTLGPSVRRDLGKQAAS